MGERAGRTAMGAFAQGGIMVARRLITVVSHPTNPVNVGPTIGVELVFRLRGVSLTENATLHYLWEGETDFLAAGTTLEGELSFTPSSPDVTITVTTKAMSVGSMDRILVLTFSNATNAAFVGDPSLTILLKSSNTSSGLVVRNDSYVVVKNTLDNVLNVLANDTANAPIAVAGVVSPVPAGIRISNDSRTLLYNAGATVLAPFNFNYIAVVPTTAETATGRVTLEVEDVFAVSNVAINQVYNSTRQANVLTSATPAGKLIISSIGTPSDSNASATITGDGQAIISTVPRDADTPVGSSTLSFTVRHTRTNATLTKTLTVTYSNQQALLGGNGAISGLPWASGNTGTAASEQMQTTRNRNHDVTMTFGSRGKGDDSKAAGWTDVRGGDVTGVALQGCFNGLNQAGGWILNLDETKFIPIITYDQWPFIYGRGGSFYKTGQARQDMFEATADGTFTDTGDLGSTDDIYDAFGAKLKRIVEARGWPAVIIRMNHECNGTLVYPHYMENINQLTPFINATRRAISRIRTAATSTNFRLYFSQNFSRNTNGAGAGPDAWVGKQYCEILELDFYDRNPPVPITDTASMNRYLNNTRGTCTRWKMRDGITPLPGCNGPATWADFCRQHDIGFGVGEWGVMTNSTGNHGGAEGDNPVFIEGIWNFFVANNDVLWYECYFNQSDSTLNSNVPLSRAKYIEKWGRPRT